MTFGRPLAIPHTITVPLPSAIDDEYLVSTGQGQQPLVEFSYLSLFTFSCQLFDILKDVLQLFSSLRPSDIASSLAEAENEKLDLRFIDTLKISRRLDRFRESLPPELVIIDGPTPIEQQHSTLNLMQQVLHCR